MFADKGLEVLKVLKMSDLYTVINASDTILNQLRLAHTVKYGISSKNDSHYSVTSKGINICDVNLMENRCSCSFMRTLMMPCRHIFAVRRSVLICQSIFEEEMVGQQWLKSYQTKDLFDQSTSGVSDGDVDPLVVQENQVHMSTFNSECKLTGTLACNQEFRKMQSLCQ